jgi:hypothetical protein
MRKEPDPLLPPAPAGGRRQPWLDRLRGRPWPLLDVAVIKKRSCKLCDVALEILERHARPLGLAVRSVDVTDDPERLGAFGDRIPVVFIEGRERFFGRVDPVLLRREVDGLRGDR